MKTRTRLFALTVIRLVENMPRTRAAEVIGRQSLRAATSVGANCRAACRGRSRAAFIARLGIVEKESDECLYGREILEESGLMNPTEPTDLKGEAGELLAIAVATLKSTKSRQ